MSTTPTPIDISHLPDLKRLAQEARKTGKLHLLRENNHVVALLTPVDTERKQQTNRQAIEATLALARSWKDLSHQIARLLHPKFFSSRRRMHNIRNHKFCELPSSRQPNYRL
jgi:hypothetical protein